MNRCSRVDQPVKACQSSNPVADDGALRSKLQRLILQDDREYCKGNLEHGSDERLAGMRRYIGSGALQTFSIAALEAAR